MFYSARRAQEAADAELSASRSGIDETEGGAAAKLAAIRDGLARGLSPQQIAADLCQDFGHGIERNHAAIGIASGLGSGRSKKASLGSVRSKKSAMASAGTL